MWGLVLAMPAASAAYASKMLHNVMGISSDNSGLAPASYEAAALVVMVLVPAIVLPADSGYLSELALL